MGANPPFLQRLEELYDSIEAWLPALGFRARRSTITITERAVEPYAAPVLHVSGSGGDELASIRPIGMQVVGAHGRADVVGAYGSRNIVYLSRGGPALTSLSVDGQPIESHARPLFRGIDSDGWYTVDQRSLTARPLNAAGFRDLLREVSDRAA